MNNNKKALFFPIFVQKYIKNSFMFTIYPNYESLGV